MAEGKEQVAWAGRSQDGQENGPRPAHLNEAVLRQLIDALADGVVLAGEDGRIVLANRLAAEMFGYQPASWPASWWSR